MSSLPRVNSFFIVKLGMSRSGVGRNVCADLLSLS